MRSALLKASQNQWLASRLPNYPFARRAVRRFMPGEHVEEALGECAVLQSRGINTVITRLGENITQVEEAAAVTRHYLDTLGEIGLRKLPTHISVKLTQLGLDVDPTFAIDSVRELMKRAAPDPVWIDIESSSYTDVTLRVFNEARASGENVGLCVQAYLLRTRADIERLLEKTTALRLVKGAYREPPSVAFARKSDVDENYLACARMLLERAKHGTVGHAPAFATHDPRIIAEIRTLADELRVPRGNYEFQMLYGINTAGQNELAAAGYPMRVLISYGEAWFAWYMRRLAERPANVLFLLRSLV